MLYVATAGDTMAEASLFSSSYHCDAIATTDAVVRLYPKAAILAEFDRNPKVARKFAAVLAHQVMTLRTRLEQRNIRAARDRVRHYLAINADADGRTVALSGTLKDMASELGSRTKPCTARSQRWRRMARSSGAEEQSEC